jgi:hypothetical protein
MSVRINSFARQGMAINAVHKIIEFAIDVVKLVPGTAYLHSFKCNHRTLVDTAVHLEITIFILCHNLLYRKYS